MASTLADENKATSPETGRGIPAHASASICTSPEVRNTPAAKTLQAPNAFLWSSVLRPRYIGMKLPMAATANSKTKTATLAATRSAMALWRATVTDRL